MYIYANEERNAVAILVLFLEAHLAGGAVVVHMLC